MENYKVIWEMAKPKKMDDGPSGVVIVGSAGCRVGKSYFVKSWEESVGIMPSFYCKAAENGMVPCEEQCFTCVQ